MKITKNYPRLYSKDSSGKGKWWEVKVTTPTIDGTKPSTITITYAGEGEKERIETREVSVGKNIGKKNETTPFEQACAEAQSDWKKKLDKGYFEDINLIDTPVLLPMLALKFDERKKDIRYPAFVQPKLDGVRVLVHKVNNKAIQYLSRQGKEYKTLEHLTPDLLKLMNVGEVWDGEVYSHEITFQEMTSYVKKLRPESSTLDIWFFDMADESRSFESRYKELRQRLINNKNSNIKLVSTFSVDDETDVHRYHNTFISQGYEGIMIRNAEGFYDFKNRSKNLQKLKLFTDEEFKIIGGKSEVKTRIDPNTNETIKYEGVVFRCINENKQEFDVRPRGGFSVTSKYLKNLKNIKGKMLTVRYQELTDDGIPRFPVGITIRDYE